MSPYACRGISDYKVEREFFFTRLQGLSLTKQLYGSYPTTRLKEFYLIAKFQVISLTKVIKGIYLTAIVISD